MPGKGRRLQLMCVLLVIIAAKMVAPFVHAEDLIVYTTLEDDEYPGYLELFKRAYPDVNVKIVRDSTGIITARLLAEKDNPQADVIRGLAATSLLVCDQAGMLQEYAPTDLAKVNATMKDTANPPHWVGIKAWETGFCVNTDDSAPFQPAEEVSSSRACLPKMSLIRTHFSRPITR